MDIKTLRDSFFEELKSVRDKEAFVACVGNLVMVEKVEKAVASYYSDDRSDTTDFPYLT